MRRVLIFANVLLLVVSTVALANQAEFKSGSNGSITNGGGDMSGGNSDVPQGQGPLPGAPPQNEGSAPSAPPAPAIEVKSGGKPPAAAPPKPGRYRYRMTVKRSQGGQETEDSREISYSVETVSTSAGETRQIWSIGSAESSSSLHYEVVWRPTEVLHLRWYSEGENGFNCDWDPDLLAGKAPLQKQLKWDAKTSCEQTTESFSIRLDYESTSTVIDAVRGSVEGTSFEGWQIQNKVTVTSRFGESSGSQTRDGNEIFSPAHGLAVKSTAKTHSTAPDGSTFDSEETLELLSLQPA